MNIENIFLYVISEQKHIQDILPIFIDFFLKILYQSLNHQTMTSMKSLIKNLRDITNQIVSFLLHLIFLSLYKNFTKKYVYKTRRKLF